MQSLDGLGLSQLVVFVHGIWSVALPPRTVTNTGLHSYFPFDPYLGDIEAVTLPKSQTTHANRREYQAYQAALHLVRSPSAIIQP
jgi:hypothetical protein